MSGVNGNGILGRPRLVDKRGPRSSKSKRASATCMVFLSGLLAAGIAPRAFAQSTARVSGLIHDQSGAVVPGATVVLRDEASGKELVYKLVGPTEADLAGGKLSVESPVAQAVVGAAVGDVVSVETPRGARSYTVVAIG